MIAAPLENNINAADAATAQQQQHLNEHEDQHQQLEDLDQDDQDEEEPDWMVFEAVAVKVMQSMMPPGSMIYPGNNIPLEIVKKISPAARIRYSKDGQINDFGLDGLATALIMAALMMMLMQSKLYGPKTQIKIADLGHFPYIVTCAKRRVPGSRAILVYPTHARISATALDYLNMLGVELVQINAPKAINEERALRLQLKGSCALRRPLRDYQLEAVHKTLTEFHQGKSCTVIGPCGIGKSLVIAEIAERLQTKSVLLIAPRTSLVTQLMQTMRTQAPSRKCIRFGGGYNFMDNFDKLVRGDERILAVSTYDSAYVASAAFLDGNLEYAVLVDEAHRLPGHNRVNDEVVRDASSVVCFTGTPVEELLEEYPAAFEMTFKQALDRGLVCDFELYLPEVVLADEEVPMSMEGFDEEQLKEGLLAQAFFLAGAMLNTGCTRVFAFFNRQVDAHSFARVLCHVGNAYFGGHGGFDSHAITQHTSAGQRVHTIKEFAKVQGNKFKIVSSVDCLSEGVDCPACAGVFLAGSYSSPVSLIQKTMRAGRLYPATKPNNVFKVFAWLSGNSPLQSSSYGVINVLAGLYDDDPERFARRVRIRPVAVLEDDEEDDEDDEEGDDEGRSEQTSTQRMETALIKERQEAARLADEEHKYQLLAAQFADRFKVFMQRRSLGPTKEQRLAAIVEKYGQNPPRSFKKRMRGDDAEDAVQARKEERTDNNFLRRNFTHDELRAHWPSWGVSTALQRAHDVVSRYSSQHPPRMYTRTFESRRTSRCCLDAEYASLWNQRRCLQTSPATLAPVVGLSCICQGYCCSRL